MIYFDTSALAKKYFINETGHGKVLEILKANPNKLFTSSLTYVEALSALTRRKHEIRDCDEAVVALKDDCDAFSVWAIDDEILTSAADLIILHRLRSADAIHLATALSISRHMKGNVFFVCSDRDLWLAAGKEGLSVIDPSVE
jgi:predicted nucleic acid-binding protein